MDTLCQRLSSCKHENLKLRFQIKLENKFLCVSDKALMLIDNNNVEMKHKKFTVESFQHHCVTHKTVAFSYVFHDLNILDDLIA